MDYKAFAFNLVKHTYISVLILGLCGSVYILYIGIYVTVTSGESKSLAETRRFIGGWWIVTGVATMVYCITAIIGGIKENVPITAIVFVISCFGAGSTLAHQRSAKLFVGQIIFIAFIGLYLKMLGTHRLSRVQNVGLIYTTDVEIVGKAGHNKPPPYQLLANTP